MEKRPSPHESATLFNIGTIKKGFDGNNWIVSTTSSGTHRWTRINYNEYRFSKINKFKKIGEINFIGNICVGGNFYTKLNLNKGLYNAYIINDNLMIAPSSYNVNRESIKNIIWKKKININVDSGFFGFYDLNIIKFLMGNRSTELPLIDIPKNSYFATTKYLVDYDRELPSNLLNYKFGVMKNTETGDEVFGCYISDNMALLLGGHTMMTLYRENELPENLKYYKKHVKK